MTEMTLNGSDELEKFYQNKADYSSIQEYIQTWNTVKNGLDSLLKSIEI